MAVRLVVIDDEYLVRQGIITSVNWEQHGIEIAGEAADGVKGLQLIRKTKPHIILTDIRMPYMDGLQMIKVVRNEFPHSKILILSVLEDFESVRQALRLGVVDYIQKLYMQPDELLNVILKIKASIKESEIDHGLDQLTSGNKAEPPVPDLKDWLSGNPSLFFDKHVRNKRYQVGVVRLYHEETGTTTSKHKVFVQSLFREIDDPLIREAHIGYDDPRHILFLITSQDPFSPAQTRNLMSEICEPHISIGLSNVLDDPEKRVIARNQANEALIESFSKGYGHIHMYKKRVWTKTTGAFFDLELLKHYQTLFEGGNEEEARQTLCTLLPKNVDEAFSPQFIRDEVYHWVSSVTFIIKEWGGDLNDYLGGESLFDQVHACETYTELRNWCFRLHKVASEILLYTKETQHRHEIKKAIDFIQEHYPEPLQLQDIARHVNLSENYLSYLFTKETGKSFSHYLQSVRVEKAKALLRNGQSQWYRVGEAVGFESAKYFAKVFKKFTGLTPLQYKKR